VQANFAAAMVSPQGVMTCQYGFGGPHPKPFFGIQKPCPAGFKCVAERNGFRTIPAIKSTQRVLTSRREGNVAGTTWLGPT
jgi:hypothetical protein